MILEMSIPTSTAKPKNKKNKSPANKESLIISKFHIYIYIKFYLLSFIAFTTDHLPHECLFNADTTEEEEYSNDSFIEMIHPNYPRFKY